MSRRRKWLRRAAVVAAVYLILWGATWAFGRSAVVRLLLTHWGTSEERDGNPREVIVRTGSRFTGEGLKFFPDPMPERVPFCCLGDPTAPAPFVVSVDMVAVGGPFAGWAGRVVCVWTPWRVYVVHQDRQWAA